LPGLGRCSRARSKAAAPQTRSRFINPLATSFRIWPAPGPSTRNPSSYAGRVPIVGRPARHPKGCPGRPHHCRMAGRSELEPEKRRQVDRRSS
jgi:hypothetical protein